jgi:hypothetical protein
MEKPYEHVMKVKLPYEGTEVIGDDAQYQMEEGQEDLADD